MASSLCLWVLVWGLIGVQADFNCSLDYDPRLPMQNQLSGHHFTIPFDEDPPYSSFVGKPGGFSYRVLAEIARRGNFTFSVTNAGTPLPGERNTDLLKRLMANEDMFGSYWTDTSDRRASGALFSAHYIDVTRLLVTLPDHVIPPDLSESMWTFLKPFRWDMWLTIAAGCALSGLVTHWFELSRLAGQGHRYRKALAEAKGVRWKTVLPYLLRSYGHFSGSGHNLEAHTVAGRLNNIVWAFLVLIIFSAYLANLASFLVIQSNRTPLYQNINALVSAKKVLCADPADSVANVYLDQYRNLLRYPLASDTNSTWKTLSTPHESLVKAMRDGKCAGVILRASTLDILQSSTQNCDLTQRDPLSAPFGAGFGFAPDRCGPYMLAVVDSIMVDMQTKGVISELWKQEVPKAACENKSTLFSVASTEALNVDSFAGLFFLYLAFVGGALILRIGRKLWVRVERKVLERLRKEGTSEDIAMGEVTDTVVPVSSKAGSGTLDERVARIDREMADILFSLRQLAHATPVHDASHDVPDTPPARASAGTLS